MQTIKEKEAKLATPSNEPQIKVDNVPSSDNVASTDIKASDIIKKFDTTSSASPSKNDTSNIDMSFFNSSELEKIEDPKLREGMKKLYGDMQRGLNDKFQKVAEARKELERKLSDLEQSKSWTPERIAQLTQDPAFLQASQAYMSQMAPKTWEGSQQEWSSLSDSDKQAFMALQGEANQLRGQVNQLLSDQTRMKIAQYDQQIKEKIPSYDPRTVDEFEQRLIKGEVDDLTRRELIYKALNYEKHIEQSYKAALQERNGSISEKMNSSTNVASSSTGVSADKPTMQSGEKPQAFFRRLAAWNIAKSKMGSK